MAEATPDPTPEEAAENALDREHLLPGEEVDIRMGSAADATHWIQAYSELLEFKERLLAVSGDTSAMATATARQESLGDHVLLQHQAGRYRARLAYWKGRAGGQGGAVREPMPD